MHPGIEHSIIVDKHEANHGIENAQNLAFITGFLPINCAFNYI